MKQYIDLLREVLDKGEAQPDNRTGIPTIALPYGSMMRFDMNDGFPLETGRAMPWKGIKGELIGFLRGCTSAAEFRELGCEFWNQNANENQAWLANPLRKGEDDLGRIYGKQWREWVGALEYVDDSAAPAEQRSTFRATFDGVEYGVLSKPMDQVMNAIHAVRKDPGNRAIIINAWKPDEFHQMALRPCHVLYQFRVNQARNELSLEMYQRSGDMFLGVPCNIASASLLLHIVARITGRKARHFTHFIADAHIYENHMDQARELVERGDRALPDLVFSDRIVPFDGSVFRPGYINMIGPDDINIAGYHPHPAIKAPMAV